MKGFENDRTSWALDPFVTMSASESGEPMIPVTFQSGELDELLTLADLAGIKGPGSTIKVVIELVTMGVPSREVYNLLREVLASRYRSKRGTTKHSSKRSGTAPDDVQENTVPQS